MKTLAFGFLLMVSGLAARADYFDQFQFHVEGSCERMEKINFHQAAPWFRVDIGTDQAGRKIYAEMNLQMFDNGSYWMSYSENVILRYLPHGGYESARIYGTTNSGEWKVLNGRLELGTLATALPQQIHDHGGVANGFLLNFSKPLHDVRLLDVSAIFGAVYGNYGPYGISVKEYCSQD